VCKIVERIRHLYFMVIGILALILFDEEINHERD
jgi:hypothetical protein